jgi:hypothetical protein
LGYNAAHRLLDGTLQYKIPHRDILQQNAV